MEMAGEEGRQVCAERRTRMHSMDKTFTVLQNSIGACLDINNLASSVLLHYVPILYNRPAIGAGMEVEIGKRKGKTIGIGKKEENRGPTTGSRHQELHKIRMSIYITFCET